MKLSKQEMQDEINYRVSVYILEKLQQEGLVTDAEALKARTLLLKEFPAITGKLEESIKAPGGSNNA